MEQNKMHFFKEKKWIMAWFFKKNQKYELTESQMMEQWRKWWRNDFPNIRDKRFQEAFEWVKETVDSMTMEQIKKKRYDIAYSKPVPKSLQNMAIAKGYYIKKAAVSKHPMSVSGYVICKSAKSKNAVYGENFNLTIKEVREFLEKQEDAKK